MGENQGRKRREEAGMDEASRRVSGGRSGRVYVGADVEREWQKAGKKAGQKV